MDTSKVIVSVRKSPEPTYQVGDYFLCVDFKIMSKSSEFGYIGKIIKIKKRKDGDHRYYYKTIARWGKIGILQDEDVLIPGSMAFLGSQKITEEEVRFLKLVMS